MTTAKILSVTAFDPYKEEADTFTAYEFSTGLILVPSEQTSDQFFESRDNIRGFGLDTITDIVETGESEWTEDELAEAVKKSLREFGFVPSGWEELVIPSVTRQISVSEFIEVLNRYPGDNIWQDVIYYVNCIIPVDVPRSMADDMICLKSGRKIYYHESSDSWY